METPSKSEEDLLARFVFVESEDEVDEEAHVHGAACSCALRGT